MITGIVESVYARTASDTVTAAVPVDGTTLTVPVMFPVDFDESGGSFSRTPANDSTSDTAMYAYTAVDVDAGTITLAQPLVAQQDNGDGTFFGGAFAVGDLLIPEPESSEYRALVQLAGSEDEPAADCRITHAMRALLPVGTRDPGAGETVLVESVDSEWVVADLVGDVPVLTSETSAEFAITDDQDNTLAGVDTDGNVSGATLAATSDVLIGGQSILNDIIPTVAGGIVAFGVYPTSRMNLGTIAGTETVLWEVDASLQANRAYLVLLSNLEFSMTGPGRLTVKVRATVDGTTPTTTSPVLMEQYQDLIPTNRTAMTVTGLSQAIQTTAATTLRMVVTALVLNDNIAGTTPAAPTAQVALPASGYSSIITGAALSVTDMGIKVDDTGTYIGNGTGNPTSGTTTKQTYTKTWTALHTHSYEGVNSDSSPNPGFSPGALMNTDGNLRQGDDQLGDNGNTSGFITWPGDVPGTLSGATIKSIKVTLNNNHSWYNNGMTVSFGWTSTVPPLGSSRPAVDHPGLSKQFISEGVTKTFTLPVSDFSTPLLNGTPFMLYHATSSRQYYGYFAGAGQNGPPKLTVTYVK